MSATSRTLTATHTTLSAMSNSEQKISVQPGYLLVERPEDYEVVWSEQLARLREISAAYKDAGCRKVLVLGPRTRVRLSMVDIFNLGEEIAKSGLQVAVVESHDASSDKVGFLETVVSNRGRPIQFFDNEQEAKDWLGVT